MQKVTIESGNNKATFNFENDKVQVVFEPEIKTQIKDATPDEVFVNNIAAIIFEGLTGGVKKDD